MKTLAIAVVLGFALPAWGAGDESELLCDSPGAGVTCTCSETFTYDDGEKFDTVFNPFRRCIRLRSNLD